MAEYKTIYNLISDMKNIIPDPTKRHTLEGMAFLSFALQDDSTPPCEHSSYGLCVAKRTVKGLSNGNILLQEESAKNTLVDRIANSVMSKEFAYHSKGNPRNFHPVFASSIKLAHKLIPIGELLADFRLDSNKGAGSMNLTDYLLRIFSSEYDLTEEQRSQKVGLIKKYLSARQDVFREIGEQAESQLLRRSKEFKHNQEESERTLKKRINSFLDAEANILGNVLEDVNKKLSG